MNAELLLEHFHRLGDAPDAVPRLRRFILELAVQGKLVEQSAKDEAVQSLVERITASRKKKFIIGLVIAAPLIVGGFEIQERSTQNGVRLFQQVISIVNERYVDSLGPGGLYERAARGLVAELKDPYAELYTPKDLEAFNQSTGGFYAGTMQEILNDRLCSRRALEANMQLISLEYRLAPEFPYPAAVDDATAALAALVEKAERFGVDTARLGIGGNSAGAGIAASTSLKLRDAGNDVLVHVDLEVPPTASFEEPFTATPQRRTPSAEQLLRSTGSSETSEGSHP